VEHLLHLLGGGCGEHLLLPTLLASFSGLTIWIKSRFEKSVEEVDNHDDMHASKTIQ